MIKEKVYYRPSVNIRMDIGKDFWIDRYLPTPSHAEATIGVLKGLLGEGPRAHLIIGPYGSGKSLLGTVLASAVANQDKNLLNTLSLKFQTVDDQIHEALCKFKNDKSLHIPIIVSNEGSSLKQSLLSALYSKLLSFKFNFTKPMIVSDILAIVDFWELEYESTYGIFLELLKKNTWTIETWRKDIERVNDKAIQWFKSVYPSLTSGSKLELSFDQDLISQLENITEELTSKNIKLFIIFDEFGRLLQSLPSSRIHETMQDLQDLAEFSNSQKGENLNFLFITHRNLGQYSLRYNEELQKEFQRIEKRFNIYYTKSDSSTFIRLSSLATKEYRQNHQVETEDIVKQLRYFNLFPDLNVTEVDSLVIKQSYPIHPVTLFVLPPLANIIAQNERTLFTFLESDEIGGLKSYYNQYEDWYRVDLIFDYFASSFSEFELDSLVGQTFVLYQRLQKKLIESPTLNDELKILKLLTIWNIAGLYTHQNPNEDLISFSYSWTQVHTRKILEDLQMRKVVRFNNALDHWELFEGSSVDIEKEIEKKLQQHPIAPRERMELLEKVLQDKYVMPRRYNDEKSMTRFARIFPIYYTELTNNNVKFEEVLKESDVIVYYVINDTTILSHQIINDLRQRSLYDNRIIFVCAEIQGIDNLLEKLSMVYLLLEDKYFLSQDKFLNDELEYISNQLIYKINNSLYCITNFDNCVWINEGEQKQIASNMDLSEFLSRVLQGVFPYTPEIRNEAFNRRKITKVQKNAALNLLNKIIGVRPNENLTIQGFGPEYLLYATLIRNNGIDFTKPYITTEYNLFLLQNELLSIINSGEGEVSELVNVCFNPPFGIRYPVIPLLLVVLLHREWKYIMFFKNGMYVRQPDAELFYEIAANPTEYSFKYVQVDPHLLAFIEQVNQVFGTEIQAMEVHPAVAVNRVLLEWLRSLPRISQNTQQTSEQANLFKELIKLGEVQPEESIERIHELCGVDHELILKNIKIECETYEENHRDNLEKEILEISNMKDFIALKSWALRQNPILKASNLFVKAIIATEEKNWLDVICEQIVGVRRENWSDTTNQLFLIQIKGCLENIKYDNVQTNFTEIKIADKSFLVENTILSEQSKAFLYSTKSNMKQLKRRIKQTELQVIAVELLKEVMSED